jgi:hypothetical protein
MKTSYFPKKLPTCDAQKDPIAIKAARHPTLQLLREHHKTQFSPMKAEQDCTVSRLNSQERYHQESERSSAC